MCSTSNVNDALKGLAVGEGSGSGSNAPSLTIGTISAHRIRQHRDGYHLVDIREPFEQEDKPFDDANSKVTMGSICHDASSLISQVPTNKTIVLVCSTGARAQVAAQSLAIQGYTSSKVLQRGLVGWDNISALSPDFLVVLGLGGDSTEKLSLSLAAAAAATDVHNQVVMVLMSDGVNWFIRQDSPKFSDKIINVETVVQGEPFKPCKAMLNKFLKAGGLTLACTTCFKHRGYDKTDLMDGVYPMQMPDLIRMMGEAKGGCLQFT